MKSTGYIGTDGKYHRGKDKPLGYDLSFSHKEWRHNLERKQFATEIIQPFVNGKPNPEFVEAYPDMAPKYFNQATIDKLKRSY